MGNLGNGGSAMPEKRNALAELAERLGEITSAWRPSEPTGQYATQSISYVRKAQRIVAELAKVETVSDLVGLIGKFRAIAEEGADNGR